ncbi:MAG: hypothetical protein IJC36_00210 [Clostridia bacterium]|nr:hypothetical protein [Clostridia bacterium]
MWMIISVCFVTVTAILGITEILRRFWLFIMRPKDSPSAIMVVYLKEDIAIQQLRYAIEFISWEKQGDFSLLAVVTNRLSEETFLKVKKIIDSRNDVILFTDL